jgi:hypothetical protein
LPDEALALQSHYNVVTLAGKVIYQVAQCRRRLVEFVEANENTDTQ